MNFKRNLSYFTDARRLNAFGCAKTIHLRNLHGNVVLSLDKPLLLFSNGRSNLICWFNSNITNKNYCNTTDNNSDPVNIDEFRNREEKREETFNQKNDTDQQEQKINEVRTKILNASLPFVETYGWSREAIAKGAEQLGYPGIVHGMFPNGGIELINHFYRECNRQMILQLNEEIKNRGPTEQITPVDLVKKAVKIRLQMNVAYLGNWHQALAIMALPPNVPTSLAQLLTMVDDICYYAGDRSIDFGWYTRRIGVATIYKMTEVYMLTDKSSDYEATWKFMERSFDECHKINSTLLLSDGAAQHVTTALSSTFLTARNILGLNFNRR